MKTYRAIFTMLIVVIAAGLFAQMAFAAGGDVTWQYGDTPQTGKQESASMIVDSAGNTIIAGSSDQSGSDDFYTVKIKADGTGVLWSKVYDKASGDDHATAVALDSSDNVIVTGYVWNGTSYDFHTIKYNEADGAVLWQHTFNAAINGNDYAISITLDSLNNVYVGGNSQGLSGADDFMIVKYGPGGPNPDDTPLWTKSYNGTANGHDRITSITAGIDGIAVTGESQNASSDFDSLTIKYGFDSTLTWEKRKSVSGNDKGMSVRMDSAGHVIAAAITYNGTDKDIYRVKYNGSTGVVIWEFTYNGGYDEEPAELYIDTFDNVYITGYTFALATANDIYTAKYNGSTGALLWSDMFNSANGNNDQAVCISIDESGDLFVAGDTYDDAASNYNFQTLKYTKDGGTLLWNKSFNGAAGKNDRVAGLGITSAGEPITAGWSDIWTSGATDYDYYAIKYDPGLLNPPTGLTAAAASTSQVDLAWTDNSSNEDNFKIERKIGDFGTYSEIASVGAGVTTYNNTGLTADTKYYYRVRAYNAADGDSYYSNETYAVTTIVSFTTPSTTYTFNGADGGDDYVSALSSGPDNTPVVTGYSYSVTGQFDYYTVKLHKDTLVSVWNDRYDSDQNDLDIARTVAIDGNNDVVVSGYSFLYSIASGGNTNDIYTIKYPSTGTPEDWNDQYNGPAGDDDRSSVVAVSVDGSNNYVVVGYGRNANWDDDIYVIKYLSNGTRDWAATPYDGGVAAHDYPSAVAFDSNGDIIVVGYTDNGTDYDYFVRKYNGVNGSPIWTDIYNISGSGNDYTTSLAVDSSDNVYVTGDAITASGNEDFYTIKYNGTNGTRLWEKSFNGLADGTDEAISLKVDPVNDDVVVAGRHLAGAGNNEFHIIRYDTDGTVVWERTLDRPGNDDIVMAMAMDNSGNVHVVGNTDSGSDTDVISVQYDYNGTFLGGAIYAGSASDNDGAAAVAANVLGEAYVGGYSINASGNADYLVYKVSNNLLQSSTPFTATPAYTQVDLAWTDNSNSEDGYYVERKVGACSSGNPWSLIYTSAADGTSHSDTLLNTNTQYCYRIQAFNNSGESSRWIERTATTLSPAAPTAFSATAVNTTQVDLAWTDNTTGEDGFKIERCEGAGCSNFAEITTVGANVTSYSDTSVCNTVSYSYRVLAYKAGQWSTNYSTADTAVTPTPSDPTVLSATRISEVQINLSWTDNTTDETGFKIERCEGAGCSNFAEIATVGVGVTTYNDTGLTEDTSHSYQVRAYKTATCVWNTNYSSSSTATTTITAPSGFSATVVNTTQINLSWTDNTASETGFKIDRCEGAGCSNFTEITTVGADTTAYSDTSLCNSISYTYRVRANKSGLWDSAYSNEDTAVTATLAAPVVLSAARASEVQIDISWTDNTSDETGFELQRCTGDINACTLDGDFAFLANAAASTSTPPVASWRFDENSGTTASDSSGNNNHGTLSGGTSWTTGISGSALSLDGVDDSYTWTYASGTPSNNFTVAAWIKATTTHQIDGESVSGTGGTGGQRYLFGASYYGSDSGAGVSVGTNGISVYEHASGYMPALAVYSGSLGTGWNHIAVTYTNKQPRIYLNGVLVRTGLTSPKTNVYAPIQGGGGSYGYFPGTMDDAKIYDYALTAGEVDNLFNGSQSSYSDTGLTAGTMYTYRLRAYKTDTCGWQTAFTNRDDAETTIAAPGSLNTSVSVGTDCSDIRFTGSDGSTLMDFWLESGCNSSSTDLWVKVPSILNGDNTIYFNFDNPSAASVSNGDNTFEFFDDFRGTTIDASKWVEIDPNNSFDQNDDLILNDVSDAWNKALISQQTFSRASDKMLYMKMKIAPDTPGNNHFMAGWELNQTSNASYTQLVYGFYWNNYNFGVYEKGSSRGATGSYVQNTEYEMKIELKAVGAKYYVKGGAFNNWTLIKETSNYTDATMRIAFTQYSHQANVHMINVRKFAASDPVITVGSAENGSYTIGPDTWNARRPITISNTGSDLTDHQLLVNLETASLAYDKVDLSWTDNTASETEFKIERCEGSGCSNFVQIDTTAADATSYSDGMVNISTTYCYQIRASKTAEWDSGYSNTSCATTSTPAAPTVLSATAIDENSVDLSWTDNTDSESGFKIERCEGAGCSVFSEIADVGPNVSSYSDTSVCNATSYTYRVKAYKTGKWDTAYTNDSTDITLTPGIPGTLTATGISEVIIDLAWVDNSTAETGFKIERCEGAGCSNFVEITTGATDATSYSDTGLAPSTTYNYRIKAYSTASCSWETGYSTATGATLTPPAPTGLNAAITNTTQLDLSWTDNTNSETGFRVQRCEGAGCTAYADLTTLAADATSYSDTTVCSNTTYRYQVRAEKTDGPVWNSPWSTYDEVPIAAPGVPGSLSATRISEARIDLSWVDNTTDETGFKIERCEGIGCSNFAEIATLGADVTTYNNTGLTYSTDYTYRVRAYKTATCSWNSGYSNTGTATTTIAAPGGFTATPANTTQVDLLWTDNTVSESGFKIERCEGAGCSNFTQIATTGSSVTSYSDTSVCNSTTYNYQVRAFLGVVWDSSYSNANDAATPGLNGPSVFLSTAVTDTQTDLSWTDNSVDETGFKIERCEGNGCSNYAEIDTAAGDATAYSDTGLTPETTYCYQVRAYKTATCGWNTVYSNASCDLTYSASPTGLTATAVNSQVIQLGWTDNANDEGGYEVEVKIWNGKFVKIATLGADVIEYKDTKAIERDKQYTYRVRAFRNTDKSPYSNEASATPPAWQASDDTCY